MTKIRQIRRFLDQLYEPEVVDSLAQRIEARLAHIKPKPGRSQRWSPEDVLLIAYADSIKDDNEYPLQSLRRFLKSHFDELISIVHLLPFFPYTSDDGFAVSDYRAVGEEYGRWEDIDALSQAVSLAFDLVINHASSSHPLFRHFIENRAPGNAYFLTGSPDDDISEVTRPRATALLQPYETARGTQHVWCTFSRDQVDWDFSNPDVLYHFIDVFLLYIERGATWIRLDAIAYLWKQLGTSCIHLPQTHAAVKLLRAIAESVSKDIKILTETNVPSQENLSYFGDGDEAHIIYNFTLPPLVIHALVTGSSQHLTQWSQALPSLPDGCTYLNFTASHDGIGLRPVEGIIDDNDLQQFTDCMEQFGGQLTLRTQPDGRLSPYEVNISLFDALQGDLDGPDGWQVERFIASQAIMMAFQGVPALYYASLLAAPNNIEGLRKTGRARTINRRKWHMNEIEERWADSDGAPAQVLTGLKALLRIRRGRAAFHPEAQQTCINVGPNVFVLRRDAIDKTDSVLCIFNLQNSEVVIGREFLQLPEMTRLVSLYNQGTFAHSSQKLSCSPYAVGWFELAD